jgi:hypothetical protein
MINSLWGLVPQSLMRTLGVVMMKITGHASIKFTHIGLLLKEDVFIFDRTPKPLNTNIVYTTTFAIH